MATSISDELLERRSKIIAEAQEIARKGVSESRDLTVEEQTSFDQRIAEADALAKRASDIAEGEQRARDLEESFRAASGRDKADRRGETESPFIKWARESRTGDSFILDAVPGSERRALGRVHGEETRAMSATAGAGPDGVYGQLWEYAIASSEILQTGVTVISTSDGNTLPLPAVTAHATGASAAANAAITASDAGLTTVNLTATKYGYLTLVPSELIADATFDLEGYLARASGRELGKIVSVIAGNAATAGYTASGATVALASYTSPSGAVFSDALIDLFHSVLSSYRTTAAFLGSDKGIATTRKARDGAGGYVWQPALSLGNPGTVDGKPFYNDSVVLSSAAATGVRPIYFGDWSTLAVRIAGGLRFERSNEYAFGTDQVAFRALVRTGAVVLDPNAVKFLAIT